MRIVDVHGRKPNDPSVTYVGRQCYGWKPSPLGNPLRYGQLPEVLARYQSWLEQQLATGNKAVVAALDDLSKDSVLGCWCVNLDDDRDKSPCCHAQIVAHVWRQRQEPQGEPIDDDQNEPL